MSALVSKAIAHAEAAHKVELDDYQSNRVYTALVDAEVLLRHTTRRDVWLDLGISGRRAGKALIAGVAQTALDYMRIVIREEHPVTEQPAPIINSGPHIADLVLEDIKARKEKGIETYGTALQPFNGRSMLQDAYEEALDLAVYLKGKILEENTCTCNRKND